jgi:mortality factor 4-like protein 1
MSETEATSLPDDTSISSSSAPTTKETTESQPSDPKFAVTQKVLSKDMDTPLLYEAVVRKLVYAPKSKKLNICLLESPDEGLLQDELQSIMDNQEQVYSWHYFVHYHGWNVKYDRWVDEDQLFPDTLESRALAKRLKEESKCLKKGASQKKVLEVMQRIVRLERELREKLAKGESIDDDVVKCKENETNHVKIRENDSGSNTTCDKKKNKDEQEIITKSFVTKEADLRKNHLTFQKCAINLPFPLKKIITDDWEIITQCGMLHSIPTPISVRDALNSYCESKEKMINENQSMQQEEKEENGESSNQNQTNEWKEMVEGIALFFDQALPKRLLFRHEVPQCLLLEERFELRYSELYPCEYLIRMCTKLPEYLEDAKQIDEDEKSKILYKIGDLLRFLSKYQDRYFLQRYRKATEEEKAKAERLKKRLGLAEDEEDATKHSDPKYVSNDETSQDYSGVASGNSDDKQDCKKRKQKFKNRNSTTKAKKYQKNE